MFPSIPMELQKGASVRITADYRAIKHSSKHSRGHKLEVALVLLGVSFASQDLLQALLADTIDR